MRFGDRRDAPPAQSCQRRSGDPAMIRGLFGSRGGAFDDAIGEFTIENADQNERDYRQLVTAVKEGRIEAIADV